ncbi:hypothetical protein [Ruegeria arenilitoris]|uniref:hypothetical protein n=1 Tax=Ruegeria arenilitoris TaxID=1173585 RepID=UPI00147EBB3D|nr:hypothetical protein [Ruegeria arenilitoris]
MDAKEQAAGEKRVRQLLIEPLTARGLKKPKGFTSQADFDAMVNKTLCPKLAYMSDLNLGALEDQIAAHPEGRDRDQMPIPNKILAFAADIQEPGDEASPLMLAVFAAQLGQDALASDWAPELRRFLKKKRKWPKADEVALIKQEAQSALRRLHDIQQREASDRVVMTEELNWRDMRSAAKHKCEEIRALALAERSEA